MGWYSQSSGGKKKKKNSTRNPISGKTVIQKWGQNIKINKTWGGSLPSDHPTRNAKGSPPHWNDRTLDTNSKSYEKINTIGKYMDHYKN